MTLADLQSILSGIKNVSIGIIGDLCLDAYWHADMKKSALSVETPHFPLPITTETYSTGAAGNVAMNAQSLCPKSVHIIAVIGKDWRGQLAKQLLTDAGIDTAHLIESQTATTNAYIKPMRHGISDVVYEDPRLDFINSAPLSAADESRILLALDAIAETCDVICVADQLPAGCITQSVRARINQLGEMGKLIVVDSRDRIMDYHHVIVKPNELEAARAFNHQDTPDMRELTQFAISLSKKNQQLALVTMGKQGCLVASESEATHVEAQIVEPPIDFCGAGDTFIAAFALALSAQAQPQAAAAFANQAAAITIKKIGTTGTAAPNELLSLP